MNGSPIATWEGAEAFFTFADSPVLIVVFLLLTLLVTCGVIAHSAKHETAAFKRYE
jgi:hypothetical protein